MTGRRLIPADQVLEVLCWRGKAIATRLPQLALDADAQDRAR